MLELLPITIFSFVFAAFSHAHSKYKKELGNYETKDKLFYFIMALGMILFVGLRTKYNDTETYLEIYDYLTPNTIPLLHEINWNIGANPAFNLVNWTIKYLGFSSQDFLMLYAGVTIAIYLWFIKKYTSNIWLSVFLLFTTGTYLFSLAAIKQCVSIAFSLVAVDRFLNKKYISFIIWIIIASLFHPYAIMFLIVPLLVYKPWTKATYISLIAFGIAGIFLQRMLGTIVDITTLLGEEYNIDSFSGDGVNPLRVAACAAPMILSFFMQKYLKAKKTSPSENLFLNLTFLNAEIMFVGLFGTANYFARLANYFLIFQCLSIPFLLNNVDKKSRKTVTFLVMVLYLLYFYYQYAFANGAFDNNFDSISFSDYTKAHKYIFRKNK